MSNEISNIPQGGGGPKFKPKNLSEYGSGLTWNQIKTEVLDRLDISDITGIENFAPNWSGESGVLTEFHFLPEHWSSVKSETLGCMQAFWGSSITSMTGEDFEGIADKTLAVESMFAFCNSLTTLDMSSLKCSGGLWSLCVDSQSLEVIRYPECDNPGICEVDGGVCGNCPNVEVIDLSKVNLYNKMISGGLGLFNQDTYSNLRELRMDTWVINSSDYYGIEEQGFFSGIPATCEWTVADQYTKNKLLEFYPDHNIIALSPNTKAPVNINTGGVSWNNFTWNEELGDFTFDSTISDVISISPVEETDVVTATIDGEGLGLVDLGYSNGEYKFGYEITGTIPIKPSIGRADVYYVITATVDDGTTTKELRGTFLVSSQAEFTGDLNITVDSGVKPLSELDPSTPVGTLTLPQKLKAWCSSIDFGSYEDLGLSLVEVSGQDGVYELYDNNSGPGRHYYQPELYLYNDEKGEACSWMAQINLGTYVDMDNDLSNVFSINPLTLAQSDRGLVGTITSNFSSGFFNVGILPESGIDDTGINVPSEYNNDGQIQLYKNEDGTVGEHNLKVYIIGQDYDEWNEYNGVVDLTVTIH